LRRADGYLRIAVVVARSGLGGAAAIVYALAGCSAQQLGSPHDGGLPSPVGQRPPPQGPAVEGGTRSVFLDGGTSAVPGDVGGTEPAGADGGAGAPSGPPVRLAPTTSLSPAYLLSAEVLAADSAGIYWLLPDNQLWMLPTGSDSPRELAVESTGPPALLTAYPGVLVASGEYLFWVSKVSPASGGTRQVLHRTKKSGGDDILVTDLKTDSVQGVAADDQYLYWTQDLSPGLSGGAQILALPRDAAPGTTPVPLVTVPSLSQAFSLAVDDQYLYWTPWAAIGATVYVATVWRGDKSGLRDGTTLGAPFVNLPASFLWPYGGSLYFVVGATTSTVRRADVAGGVARLPLVAGSLAFFGDCIVSSTAVAGMSPKQGLIYAMPLAGGAAQVEVAAGVAVPPVVAAPGLVFVNGTGELVAISPTDFRAALASGEP
jgi:hypothetical protein